MTNIQRQMKQSQSLLSLTAESEMIDIFIFKRKFNSKPAHTKSSAVNKVMIMETSSLSHHSADKLF